MSYSRRWLEECGSEDSHGRALWALGTVVGRSANPGRHSLAGQLFHAALPATSTFTSPRAWAFTLLGIDEYLRAFSGDSRGPGGAHGARRAAPRSATRARARPTGRGSRSALTYCNARLSQALIVSAARMQDEAMRSAGLRSLDWLFGKQLSSDGMFAPIGSNGFYRRGGRARAFRSAAGRSLRHDLGLPRSASRDRRRVAGSIARARLRLVPRRQRAARAALRRRHRRLPRRAARRSRQREPGRGVDAVVSARAHRDACGRSRRSDEWDRKSQ